MPTYVRALTGIRTHDPSIKAVQDIGALDRALFISLCETRDSFD
jgi:hypothetical protein